MRRLWMTLALCLTLPALVCKADMPVFSDTPAAHVPQNLLKQNTLPESPVKDATELRYGFSSLRFKNGAPQGVKLDHQIYAADGSGFTLEKTAEASVLPSGLTAPGLEKICNAINEADELNDLRAVLSPGYYQNLENKVAEGSSQYVVLAMLQAMRPYDIRVMDFTVQEDQVSLAVKGRSYFGPVGGLIHLVKQDGLWRIGKEDWFAGGRETKDHIAASLNPLFGKNKYAVKRPGGLMAQLSPDSRVNRNMLALSRAPYHKNGRSLNFVFMLKKSKTNADRSPDIYDRGNAADEKRRPRAPMHVMWTGSKRLMPEQKVVDVNSPIDFSIANYDDGYSPGQWNFIMPTKKPREVTVSLLMNF